MGACLNCLRQPQAEGPDTAATSKWPLVTWFKKLTDIEKLRLGGIAISCLETILLVVVISTVSWVKRFVRGIFVYQGLWQECSLGNCVYLVDRPNYIYISIFFMLLSAATSYGSVVTGTLCLTPIQPPKWLTTTWPTLTIGLCFVSGFNGAMGLFNYMRAATEMPNTFLSWSLAPGWLSVILATMAGVCHLVAKKWEQDEDTTELFAGMTMKTLKEDMVENPVSQSALKGRPKGSKSKSVTVL